MQPMLQGFGRRDPRGGVRDPRGAVAPETHDDVQLVIREGVHNQARRDGSTPPRSDEPRRRRLYKEDWLGPTQATTGDGTFQVLEQDALELVGAGVVGFQCWTSHRAGNHPKVVALPGFGPFFNLDAGDPAQVGATERPPAVLLAANRDQRVQGNVDAPDGKPLHGPAVVGHLLGRGGVRPVQLTQYL